VEVKEQFIFIIFKRMKNVRNAKEKVIKIIVKPVLVKGWSLKNSNNKFIYKKVLQIKQFFVNKEQGVMEFVIKMEIYMLKYKYRKIIIMLWMETMSKQ
jgi:hypothetical protein